jgi:hypothetical protein
MSAIQNTSVSSTTRRKFIGINDANILDELNLDDVGQQISALLLLSMQRIYSSAVTSPDDRYAVYKWVFEGEPDSFGRTLDEVLITLKIDHLYDYIYGVFTDICHDSWSVKEYRKTSLGIQQSLFC